ncbi:nickel pincer cofactor biosynthesis protein LarC [Natronomonas sp. EA1]|uniref:nickel pincer cofactor biosynthesis protein LarC n=1 Tax=Natronomonas sp. EA1 TaxID=3421655 RepID=UPI003EBF7E43
MRTLAFDGRTGASGDMLLGALVAVGADPAALAPVEAALDVEYRVREVDKNGILATKVDVLAGDGEDRDGEDRDGDDDTGEAHTPSIIPSQAHDHSHSHEHSDHSHDHDDHSHSHDAHSHDHAEGHGPHRTYPEVIAVVEGMGLPESVEANAKAVFEILGEAEAAVHGTDLDSTHFHEVGADDAIADIVGVCLLLDDLDIERVVTTPVRAGGGTVRMSHGTYPVPAPAVMNVAAVADWDLQGGPIDAELLTPTGAALLAHFAEGVPSLPPLDIEATGYGAGTKAFPDHPNVIRGVVGESEGELIRDDVRVLETNLDDAPPEVLGSLHETLKEAGARDVSIVPLTMKKSRPGHLVKVVVKPDDVQAVARKLAVETGTLGVRETSVRHRWVSKRTFETVTLAIEGEEYEVSVKIASDSEGERYDASAEFDDALAVARATGLPVREVMRRAEAKVLE